MKRLSLVLSSVMTIGLLAGSTATAFANSGNNPAGNNGVVKINDEVAPDSIPNNDPHVSCTFNVEFYNYDKNNNIADVEFALQAPTNKSGDSLKVTSGNQHPFIGGDAAGGGTDLDARESYTLNFTGTPQANQGYHVKVTVNAPGSQGSTKKSKVFWVQPCAQSSNSTPQVKGESTSTPSSSSNESANSEATPTELPNTGSGNTLIALFISSTVAATVAHYIWRHRRISA